MIRDFDVFYCESTVVSSSQTTISAQGVIDISACAYSDNALHRNSGLATPSGNLS